VFVLLLLQSITASASWSVMLRRWEGLSSGFEIASRASVRLLRAAEDTLMLLRVAPYCWVGQYSDVLLLRPTKPPAKLLAAVPDAASIEVL
jgi:hypothetical protein